jgi:hypothetical protein
MNIEHCEKCCIPTGMSYPPSFLCWDTCPCHSVAEGGESWQKKLWDILVKSDSRTEVEHDLQALFHTELSAICEEVEGEKDANNSDREAQCVNYGLDKALSIIKKRMK